MNLYHISQTVNQDYDTFDSAVVCAPDGETAQKMRPGDPRYDSTQAGSWCEPEHVTVRLIGTATADVAPGVVCASFNAG